MILRNRLNYRLLLLPLLLAITTIAAHAQQNSEIVGTITDKQGAVVSGAKVSLVSQSTGQTLESQQQRVRPVPLRRIEPGDLRPEGHGNRLRILRPAGSTAERFPDLYGQTAS